MLSTDEQKKICAKYRKRGNDGLVRCNQCPLVISVSLCMCHANSHYDPDKCDFEFDDNFKKRKLNRKNENMHEEKNNG